MLLSHVLENLHPPQAERSARSDAAARCYTALIRHWVSVLVWYVAPWETETLESPQPFVQFGRVWDSC